MIIYFETIYTWQSVAELAQFIHVEVAIILKTNSVTFLWHLKP